MKRSTYRLSLAPREMVGTRGSVKPIELEKLRDAYGDARL